MTVLLSVSIGPVQDFIKAARKARDLWFGSALLEEMSHAAAKALHDRGARLIFPASATITDGGSVANKILALVDADDPTAIAEESRAAAYAVLDGHRAKAMAESQAHRLRVDTDLLERQLRGFLEFSYAWIPYRGPASYTEDRKMVERLLAGRKALRDFAPADGRAGRPNSSLDPARESVLPDGRDGPIRPSVRIKQGEHLDGISLIKRMASTERFVSVARVAAEPFIRRAVEQQRPELAQLNDLAARLDTLQAAERFPTRDGTGLEHYAPFPYDTELFYSDGRGDPDLGDEGSEPSRLARQFFDVVQRLRHAIGMAPPSYFALLHADGDQMGRAIGDMHTPDDHERLSLALGGFAAEAGVIVRGHHGALIYSGGDDVLAFLPLDTALDCADALRRAFADTMAAVPGLSPVTLSVGLAIGHYREPLDNLLDWARAAERLAKVGERNQLAVAFHAASGGASATTTVHSWTGDPVAEHWRAWQNLYQEDALPDGAAYELRALSRELRGLPTDTARLLAAVEARRILSRKYGRRGTEQINPEIVERIIKRIVPSAEAAPDGSTVLDTLDGIVNEMLIARRLVGSTTGEGDATYDSRD